jgi:predicted dienelactone hydrolase
MWQMLRKRLLRGLAALIIGGVAGIALFVGWLRLEHGLSLTLPEPTGPYPVGRVVYHWVDDSRADVLASAAGQKRELMIWVWYPAAPKPGEKTAEYLPATWRAALDPIQGVLMSGLFTRDPAVVRTHSVPDADVAPSERPYPILLMKSGIGALACDYTAIAEDLASHGYVVVGSDSPHSTVVVVFPDGRVAERTPAGRPGRVPSPGERDPEVHRVVDVWSADTRFELDRLERLNADDPSGRFRGRLDLGAVGAFGHSFGGATAAQFCHDDPRCKAGIDLDGSPFGSVIEEGVARPFLFLMSDHGKPADEIGRRILANIRSIRARTKRPCPEWVLRGTRHFNFSDQCLMKDRLLTRIVGGAGPIDARRGLAIASECVRTFFDVHLKGAPAARFEGLPSRFPEIAVEPGA